MARRVVTKYLDIYFGWHYEEKEYKNWLGLKKKNIEHFFMRIPFQDFRQRMKEIVHQINREQYEIKAVMPLTEGMCAYEVNSKEPSWGYGFGASTIVGYGLIIQKTLEGSQEELDISVLLVDVTARKHELEDALPDLQKAFDEAASKGREVVEKKGILGRSYYVNDELIPNKLNAEEMVKNNVALYEKALAELNSVKDELAQVNATFNELSVVGHT